MQEPGLDGRHRDKDGEISRKHGNTQVHTLRKIYGQSFGSSFGETAKLSEILAKEPSHRSLTQLRKDHIEGLLERKIQRSS